MQIAEKLGRGPPGRRLHLVSAAANMLHASRAASSASTKAASGHAHPCGVYARFDQE